MRRDFTAGILFLVLAAACTPYLPGDGQGGSVTNHYHCGYDTALRGMVIVTNADTNQTWTLTNMVSIESAGFVPSNVIIPQGSFVRWDNNDSTTHSVQADDGSFLLTPILTGQFGKLRF